MTGHFTLSGPVVLLVVGQPIPVFGFGQAAIFGRDMLFHIPFLADWNKIGEHRQHQTDLNTNVKIAHIMIGTTKLVIKYFLGKMVSSANQELV